jgi:hypothetical protein
MSGHTPGPWRLRLVYSGMCNGASIGAEILPPEPFTGPVLATVHHREADARLIAAAPDQNAALMSAPKWPKKGLTFDEAGEWAIKYREWYEGARAAAIAKAEGR